jgi:hypothetical protein
VVLYCHFFGKHDQLLFLSLAKRRCLAGQQMRVDGKPLKQKRFLPL